jgi:hypothetical protein
MVDSKTVVTLSTPISSLYTLLFQCCFLFTLSPTLSVYSGSSLLLNSSLFPPYRHFRTRIVPFLLLIDIHQPLGFYKRHAFPCLNHTAFTEKATRSFLYHMQLHPMTGSSMVRCVAGASQSSWKLFVFKAKGRVGAWKCGS